jgi:hypothetical protein
MNNPRPKVEDIYALIDKLNKRIDELEKNSKRFEEIEDAIRKILSYINSLEISFKAFNLSLKNLNKLFS